MALSEALVALGIAVSNIANRVYKNSQKILAILYDFIYNQCSCLFAVSEPQLLLDGGTVC